MEIYFAKGSRRHTMLAFGIKESDCATHVSISDKRAFSKHIEYMNMVA